MIRNAQPFRAKKPANVDKIFRPAKIFKGKCTLRAAFSVLVGEKDMQVVVGFWCRKTAITTYSNPGSLNCRIIVLVNNKFRIIKSVNPICWIYRFIRENDCRFLYALHEFFQFVNR